jgi:hypothetical protein
MSLRLWMRRLNLALMMRRVASPHRQRRREWTESVVFVFLTVL